LSPGSHERGQRPGADLSGADRELSGGGHCADRQRCARAGNTKILLINGGMNILNIIISSVLIYGVFSWDGFVGAGLG
jgi:hypothetical protein